ncbi:MAG: ArnT family glycosyltransferase [Rhodomicrobiaceae bacterium]
MSSEDLTASRRIRGASARSDAALQQSAENYALTLLACVAALTAMRVIANIFANTELFFDEAQYWFWSRELAFGYYSKPPLIGWLIRGATELCGQGEACIRSPSALIHAATAMVIFAIGRQLYSPRIGFWSGLTYATLPGVSLSASLISTDAPLLFFVSLALLAVLKMRDSQGWGWALLFGVAVGLGFLSKYAMVYFLLCLGLWLAWRRDDRFLLSDARFYAGLAIGAAILAPNVIWNAQNGFATLSHTADNANWSGPLLHPVGMLEFAGGQFGVFGPVMFAVLLAYCFNWLRDPQRRAEAGRAERLLLAFSIPVILLMTMQALLSRAHANWAAFAYVAAMVLITSALLREGWTRLFRVSLGIHLFFALLIAAGGILAGRVALPGADPYARVLGWKAIAESAAGTARQGGFQAIATDRRALAAELLYYLRDDGIPVVALRGEGPPTDHFELTRPLDASTPRPVLLVSFRRDGPPASQLVGDREIAAGPSETRRVYFHALNADKVR